MLASINMNQDQLEGLLKQLCGSVRARWGAANKDPLAIAAGARDKLAGRLQQQRGNSKATADRQLAEFRNRNRNWLDLSK
jgi:uncharacterized protein YjbJ (UPF0337 family)